MLNSLLLYVGDIQREGRLVTGRIRLKVILNLLIIFFAIVAFIAAVIGGCIFLAKLIGPIAAAFLVSGISLVLVAIFYLWLTLLDRSHRRATLRARTAVVSPAAAVTATQVATQAALLSAVKKRPYLTLLASAAIGFLATRTTIQK